MPSGASPAARIVLLGSVFVVAACGLVYELVAGAVSSYILGDAVTQFSLVIGVFLCAMGFGSYLAQFFKTKLLKTFIEVEIWIGLVGGLSSMAMYATGAFASAIFPVVFYSLCALVGVLIGIEIPLLIRILKTDQTFPAAVSQVLALDYIGALAGSLLFPFLILPYLGLSRASLVFGIMNLAVAGIGISLLEEKRTWLILRAAVAGLLLIVGVVFSARWVGFLEDLLYQDNIIFSQTSRYQRIVVTRWRDDTRLYLNGHLQFCSVDEARYHEALVIPAMTACARPQQVLVLGGGDGLAVREILKYDTVIHITLVDIDPAVTDLARTRPELIAVNKNALNHPKVAVVNQDAFQFMQSSRNFYDVIIADLPDPSSETLAKLYSTAFYALCARRLSAGGVMVTQATSPFYAPEAFWCILHTIEGALKSGPQRLKAVPYHVNVPSFGEWGFVMAAVHSLNPLTLDVPVPTRFLTGPSLRAMYSFGRDLHAQGEPQINRLDHPVVFEYYKSGWRQFND